MTEVQRNTKEPIDSIEPDPETTTSDTKKDTNPTDNTNNEDNELNAERNRHRKVAEEIVRNITDQVKSENFVHEKLFQPTNSDRSGKEIKMEKSDMVTQEIDDITTHSMEFIQKESNVDSIQTSDNERNIETMKANAEVPVNLVKPNEKDSMIKAHNRNVETNSGNSNSVTENSNAESNDTKAHTVVENSVARDRMDKNISNEFIPDLNIDDTDVDNSGTNIDSGNDTMGPEGDDGAPESNKVLWTLNGSDHDNHKVG